MPGGTAKMLPFLQHERAYRNHRQKIMEAHSQTDSSPPKPQVHLQLRLKQYQMQEERYAIIDRDNRLLKNKMEAIMMSTGNSTIHPKKEYEGKSLNAEYRDRQRTKILLDNLAVARRIEMTRPVYRVERWEADYKKQRQISDSWRKKNAKYRVYALPDDRRTRSKRESDDYESDFESDNDQDDDDDKNRQKRKGNKLPPIKAGQQQEKGNDTRRSRADSPQSPRGRGDRHSPPDSHRGRKWEYISPDPHLWMYYGARPFSDDEDEDVSPRDGKKKEHDEEKDKADRQAESDAKQLFKVAKELAPPHDIIIRTLAKKSFNQRMKTKDKFNELYDLDMESELKKGLGNKWSLLIECLLNDQNEGQSEGVCKSMKSGDPVALVKKLTPLSNQELADLKEEYYKENSSNLESDITKKFTVPTETLLLTLVKGSKNEKEEVNEKQAEKDAKALFEFGNGRWTSNKGKFIRLLEDRTPTHMNSVFNSYKNLNKGKPVNKSVQEECTKDYAQVVNAYVSATESAGSETADNLHRNLDPTNPVFVKTVVARSETDIHKVRKEYKKKYGNELVEDLEQKSDHTTVPVLRILIEKNPKAKHGKKGRGKGGDEGDRTQRDDEGDDDQDKADEEQEEAFNPDTDAQKLYAAMKGLGTKEDDIIDIIPKRTNAERQQIKKKYQEKYKKDLMKELESELSGDFGDAILGLMMTPVEYDAHCLKRATKGFGTDETTLIGIICSKNDAEMAAIKKAYKSAYKKDLEADVKGDTSGDFRDLLLKLIADEDKNAKVDKEKAEKDAQTLEEEPSDDIYREVFIVSSDAQLNATAKAYKDLYKKDITEAIQKKTSGDLRDGYLARVKASGDMTSFYAVRLNNSMKGAGTNEAQLTRILVTTSEKELPAVSSKYKELYGNDLKKDVESETSGDYRKTLLRLLSHHGSSEDDNQSKKQKKDDKSQKKPAENGQQKTKKEGKVKSEAVSKEREDKHDKSKTGRREEGTKGKTNEQKEKERNEQNQREAEQKKKESEQKKKEADRKNEKKTKDKDEGGEKNKRKQEDEKKKEEKKDKKGKDKEGEDEDAVRLFKAMKGFGTDEDVIIDIIPCRTNAQRQEIKARYQELFSKDLEKELQSELSGDFREVILALMVPSDQYEAECLDDAMKGRGADETAMIGLLCSKTPEELEKLNDTYKKNNNKDLADVISKESKGDFKDVILQVLKGERDTTSEADKQKAETDAELIGNKFNVNVIKELYSKGSAAQIKATEEAHMKLYNKDIRESIQGACSGDEEKLYLALASSQGDPTDFYVERLYNSMKGIGTNDSQLIRILVSRSEVDLPAVKENYQKKYGTVLRKDVESETSGDYRATLLKLIDGAGKGGGDKKQAKKSENPRKQKEAAPVKTAPEKRVNKSVVAEKKNDVKKKPDEERKIKEDRKQEAAPRKGEEEKKKSNEEKKRKDEEERKKKEEEENKKKEVELKKREEMAAKKKKEEQEKKNEEEAKKTESPKKETRTKETRTTVVKAEVKETDDKKQKEEERKKREEEERKKKEEERKKKEEAERKKKEEVENKKKEEERKKREEDERRKKEEERKKKEDEEKKKKDEELKKKEEEKKKREEEEHKKKEEERKKKEADEAKKKEEEKKKKEEEERKKKEEERKKIESEEAKKKEEERKQKELMLIKQQEEQKKKEEEEKKKAEEEQKRKAEEEKKRKEEEEKKKEMEKQKNNAEKQKEVIKDEKKDVKEEKQEEKEEENNEDAVRLYKAMKGLGTDEKVIVDIIPCRTNAERQGIKARYQELYKKDLDSALKSELSGDLEETVTALMMPQVQYDAYCLHEADETSLIGVICSKTPAEMEEITKAYRTMYNSELQTDIGKKAGSGEFGKLITELAGGLKPSTEVDMAKAEADAKEIHDEPSEKCFNRVFTENSRVQMTATSEAHQRLFNQDISESLKRSSSDDAEATYIGLVEAFRNESEFYARRLNNAMKGLGTNDSQLIRILVSRSETDLPVIKNMYQEIYGHTLREDVESETSGDYKQLLLKLLDEADNLVKEKKEETVEGTTKEKGKRAQTPKSPAENRRAEMAAKRLFKCMEDSGTDEEGIVDIITNQPNKERQKTKAKYHDLYKKDLVSDLGNELSGDLKEAILALMMPPLEYDAYCLHEALRGYGTDDTVLIGMLTCKKAAELDDIKKTYKKLFSKDLLEDIEKDTSGDYRDLLLQLASAQRDQSSRVDKDKADQDAKNIRDEPSTTVFTEVFVKSSRAHVKAVAEAHQKLFDAAIVDSVSRVTMGDISHTYAAIVNSCIDETGYYADRLNHAIYGLGTNDSLLIRLIVSKSETDLHNIQVKYRNIFNRSLREDVHNDLSGEYRKALVKLMDK